MFIPTNKLNLTLDKDYVAGIECHIQFVVTAVDKDKKIISGTEKTFHDEYLDKMLLEELISKNKDAIETVVLNARK